MRTALICIVRNENPYLQEFVSHYIGLGFKKIFLCDNGYGNEPSPFEVIGKYIPYVEVIDYRNRPHPQNVAYNECYEKYGKAFDWIAFFDCDEFLVLKHDKTISQYLSRFPRDAELITINWQTMTDNNLLQYENKPLMHRFTTPMALKKKILCNFPENRHVKCIVKGFLPKVTWENPHCPIEKLVSYHSSIKKNNQSGIQGINYTFAMLRHFPTKTIEEWCRNKVPRKRVHNGGEYAPEKFFRYNEKTPEKVKIMKSFFPNAKT